MATSDNRPNDKQQKPSAKGASQPASVVDRRSGLDRRRLPGADDRTAPADLDRRRGAGRRLSDFAKAAEEGEHTREQFLFVTAIDAFKRKSGATFPAWGDVVQVVRDLGYRKTVHSQIGVPGAKDWLEPADAPAVASAHSAAAPEKTAEHQLFGAAIDAFKRANQKTFPMWTEVLEVLRLLGYRKTCSSRLDLQNAEDWREAADAPANVRTHRGEAA